MPSLKIATIGGNRNGGSMLKKAADTTTDDLIRQAKAQFGDERVTLTELVSMAPSTLRDAMDFVIADAGYHDSLSNTDQALRWLSQICARLEECGPRTTAPKAPLSLAA